MRLIDRDTIKFGVLVGLLAILMDAAIAHGLFWENDPYWTYWITKTFLIATVFTVGTRFLGIGLWQGAAITVVHTLILEVYYEFLAPIGLPQEAHWLPFHDLWTSGFLAHYLTILAGYFIALWLWYRSRNQAIEQRVAVTRHGPIVRALPLSIILVLLDVLFVHMLVIGEFPGITYMVQRLLVTFVLVSVWLSFVGLRRTQDKVAAAFLLSLVWVSYSMYLEPVGLPSNFFRYLNYEELWMQMFPASFVINLIAFCVLQTPPAEVLRNRKLLAAFAFAAMLAVSPVAVASPGLEGGARAEGKAHAIVGDNPYDTKNTISASGYIDIKVVDEGNRWSHLQNKDKLDIVAEVDFAGSKYRVIMKKPLLRHPQGAYPTWSGVGYNIPMHGQTGVGTSKLPEVMSDIAIWGLAEVYKDGQLINKTALSHVMVMREGPLKGIMLEVETEDKNLLAAPDGYLNVMWHDIHGLSIPEETEHERELLGMSVLVLTTGIFGYLAKKEEDLVPNG